MITRSFTRDLSNYDNESERHRERDRETETETDRERHRERDILRYLLILLYLMETTATN